MLHKSGVAILVVYQAANSETGATINVDVYDEAHVKDVGKSGDATEIVATGRYYFAFTPDAAGTWATCLQKSDATGKVVKSFVVKAADEFGIKAVADGIQTDLDNATDGLGALKTIIDGKAASGEYDTQMGAVILAPKDEYDTQMGSVLLGDKTSLDAIQTDLDNATDGLGALKTLIDAKAASGEYDTQMGAVILAPKDEYDTQMGSVLLGDKTSLDAVLADTDTMEADIRGADSDTLKSLSDQIDAVSSPAMAG